MRQALTGKVAVVTGVTSGIGEALCRRLLAEGMTVVGVARNQQQLAARAERWGSDFVPLLADLADPAARAAVCSAILERFQQLHLLVNNAAEIVYATPLELELTRWRTLLEVNVLAAIELAQALVPALHGGHIVNLSSVTARFTANARFAPYAISKAAVERLTEALRLELQPLRIKVSLVVPGLVDTPLYDKVAGFDRARARLSEQVPTWLQAEDVAEAVAWLLSQPEHVVVSELVLLPRDQAR